MKNRNIEPKTEEQRIRARISKIATVIVARTLYVSNVHGAERESEKPGSKESQKRKD